MVIYIACVHDKAAARSLLRAVCVSVGEGEGEGEGPGCDRRLLLVRMQSFLPGPFAGTG